MRTMYEVIWSIVGIMIISWFIASFIFECHNAAVLPTVTPTSEKQSIEQFLNDHPDIKKRVDELNRQADADQKYKRS